MPAFVEAAHVAAERKKFGDALAQVNAALDYDPDHAPARLLKGQLLVARKDFTAARQELERYLKARPADAQAAKLARLCATATVDDPAIAVDLADILIMQHMAALAEGLIRSPDKLRDVHRQRIEKTWPGLGERLTMDADGRLSLSLADCQQVLDLTPLKGMPLRTLQIHRSEIRDLSPLMGMPLTWLDLNGCRRISDLTPLKGMKLTYLSLQSCGDLQGFAVLKGMPLTSLYLHARRLGNRDLRLLAPCAADRTDSRFIGGTQRLDANQGEENNSLGTQLVPSNNGSHAAPGHAVDLAELERLRPDPGPDAAPRHAADVS